MYQGVLQYFRHIRFIQAREQAKQKEGGGEEEADNNKYSFYDMLEGDKYYQKKKIKSRAR